MLCIKRTKLVINFKNFFKFIQLKRINLNKKAVVKLNIMFYSFYFLNVNSYQLLYQCIGSDIPQYNFSCA